jgi:hypothetical protein
MNEEPLTIFTGHLGHEIINDFIAKSSQIEDTAKEILRKKKRFPGDKHNKKGKIQLR